MEFSPRFPGATDLVSDKKFFNFVLDAEYRMEPHSNSGIGLRGRYEVQLIDDRRSSAIQSHDRFNFGPHRAYA